LKRVYVTVLLLCGVAAVPVFADSIPVAAKAQCQVEYGGHAELSTACAHGVDLAERAAEQVQEAVRDCERDTRDAGTASACQRGVLLDARRAGRLRGEDASSFSHAWSQGRGGAKVDLGDYQVHVGDAEKSIEDCTRAFEGSSTPPSCLSGLTIQQKPSREAAPR
jgi:hypothetical protein